MYSLPMISHHLFAAAAGNERAADEEPAGGDTLALEAAPTTIAAPLEVLDSAHPAAVGAMRPLRATVVADELQAR